jgi:hypothetical protein
VSGVVAGYYPQGITIVVGRVYSSNGPRIYLLARGDIHYGPVLLPKVSTQYGKKEIASAIKDEMGYPVETIDWAWSELVTAYLN